MLNRLLLFDQLQVSPTGSRPFLMTCTTEPRLSPPSMASRFLSSISIALKRNFRLMSICMRPRCMRKLVSSSTLAAPMAHSSPSLRRASICMSLRWAGARRRASWHAARLTTISIRHIDALDAQTGPIFLTYRDSDAIDILVAGVKKTAPLYDFAGEDGVTHRVWRMAAASEETACSQAYAGLVAAFAKVPCAYIADGHHRAASAVKVGLARREANPGYDGTEEFNYFMSVLFPASQLSILAYNRVVRDLNGLTLLSHS